MKRWTKYCTGLVAAASLTPGIRAQVPAVPAVPAAPAAAPQTLWSFLGVSKDQKEDLKRKCCKTPFGQLLNNALRPVSILSGGILGNFCPTTPTPEDLAKPGAEGAAAKIMADEANAKARRAAVRYLGTVDCHYWGPEAEPALIAALRTDRNECVRWEAAMALGRGCCCTKKTIQALAITVSSSDKDGNPSEKSDRVKSAATFALEHCLACYHEITPAPAAEETPPPKRLEPPPAKPVERPTGTSATSADGSGVRLAAYYRNVDSNMTMKQVVDNAKRMLQERGHVLVSSAPPSGYAGGSLYELFVRSAGFNGDSAKYSVAPVVEAAPTDARLVPVEPNAPAVSAPQPPPAEVAPVALKAPAPAVPAPVVPATLPSADQPPAAASTTTAQRVATLRSGFYPDQRESAATHLATHENKADAQVINALLESARLDTAPTVRVACIRGLANLGVNTPAVLSVLRALKTDVDPRVRLAAEKALTVLGTVQPVAAGSTVQAPTGAFIVPQPTR